MTILGWGGGAFGGMPWGGGGGGTLFLLSVLPIRENVIRLEFSVPLYFSILLDPPDASIPTKYVVTPVSGTIGLDGDPVHPVNVAGVSLPSVVAGILASDVGRFVDITLDRPMSPYPTRYTVTVTNIFSADLVEALDPDPSSLSFDALFKKLEEPQIATTRPSRDLANAQTGNAATSSLPDPEDTLLNLGSLRVDDSGDYAFDEGLVNFKKRIIRRLVTSPGKFAHLPKYGVGIPDYGKRLAVSSVIASLAAQAEAQISLEPETSRVRVRPIVDPNTPGLVRFQIFVRPKSGEPQRFDVPFTFA